MAKDGKAAAALGIGGAVAAIVGALVYFFTKGAPPLPTPLTPTPPPPGVDIPTTREEKIAAAAKLRAEQDMGPIRQKIASGASPAAIIAQIDVIAKSRAAAGIVPVSTEEMRALRVKYLEISRSNKARLEEWRKAMVLQQMAVELTAIAASIPKISADARLGATRFRAAMAAGNKGVAEDNYRYAQEKYTLWRAILVRLGAPLDVQSIQSTEGGALANEYRAKYGQEALNALNRTLLSIGDHQKKYANVYKFAPRIPGSGPPEYLSTSGAQVVMGYAGDFTHGPVWRM